MANERIKTIAITAGPEMLIPRYFLRYGMLAGITKRSDIRVVLLVESRYLEGYRKEFENERVRVVPMPQVKPSYLFEKLLSFSRIAFHRKMGKYWQWTEYMSFNVSRPRMYLNRLIAMCLGTYPPIARLVQGAVRWGISHIAAPQEVSFFFNTYKPDLLYATSVMYALFDVPVIVEAKRRGITVIGGARGWDQLSNVGFMLAHPDYLILQNEYIRYAAIRFNFFPEKRIFVTGFRHFDMYRRKDLILPRAEFLKTLGISPEKRMILFGAVGGIMHARELSFAEMFNEMVARGVLPGDLVLVFRTHPYYASKLPDELSTLRHVVVDRIRAKGIPEPGFPDDDFRDMVHQMNSFYHCELLVTPSGTVVLDAAAFNKPIVILAFDGKDPYPYWRSLARVHDGTSQDWWAVGQCRGMRYAYSSEEFARAVDEYLKNPSEDQEGRRCIARRFVEPFQGDSSERMVRIILEIIDGITSSS